MLQSASSVVAARAMDTTSFLTSTKRNAVVDSMVSSLGVLEHGLNLLKVQNVTIQKIFSDLQHLLNIFTSMVSIIVVSKVDVMQVSFCTGGTTEGGTRSYTTKLDIHV